MAWIKVHAGASKVRYWFNSDQIVHIHDYGFTAGTHNSTITFAVQDSSKKEQWVLSVHETPEEIIEMISAAVALADRMTS
jgi:hypothetical protein